MLFDRGLLSAVNAKTGKVLYDRERLPDGFAFTASPWAVDGRIYCLNEDGACYVVRAGRPIRVAASTGCPTTTCAWPRPPSPETDSLIRSAS